MREGRRRGERVRREGREVRGQGREGEGRPSGRTCASADPPRSALGARSMFYYAAAFSCDLGRWDVSNVTTMEE